MVGYPVVMTFPDRRFRTNVGKVLLQVERSLIGFERLPPAEMLDRAEWRSDRPDSYCPRCGASVIFSDASADCCAGRRLPYQRVVRLGSYEGCLGDWLRGVKFQCWPGMARMLGTILGRAIAKELCGQDEIEYPIVVPVPMPALRKWMRKVDHARLLAGAVARELNAPLRQPLRQVAGRTQASRTASQRKRRQNPFVQRVFTRPLGGRSVVLIDDVATTGRTAMAAARVLRAHGAGPVLLGVVAVAPGKTSR